MEIYVQREYEPMHNTDNCSLLLIYIYILELEREGREGKGEVGGGGEGEGEKMVYCGTIYYGRQEKQEKQEKNRKINHRMYAWSVV